MQKREHSARRGPGCQGTGHDWGAGRVACPASTPQGPSGGSQPKDQESRGRGGPAQRGFQSFDLSRSLYSLGPGGLTRPGVRRGSAQTSGGKRPCPRPPSLRPSVCLCTAPGEPVGVTRERFGAARGGLSVGAVPRPPCCPVTMRLPGVDPLGWAGCVDGRAGCVDGAASSSHWDPCPLCLGSGQ